MQTADRTQRSVFVGNIPYDTTEEKLRDIFSAVGPVLSFRIVFDRETGKPKGYGFCEYKDTETATSAIRNLNGHDLNGRQLRVDSATNERGRDEPDAGANNSNDQQMSHQQQHQQLPVPPVVEPLVDVQTLISNVVNALQPELLFDLCKQLKSSLLINPNETRQLLMQNPQLSYALLQSLVRIKAIDAQTAMNTFHKPLMQPAPLQPMLPMLAPLTAPSIPNAQAPAPAPMVMQAQAPLVMQPQVMNPFAFMGDNQMVATSNANQQAPSHIPTASMAPPVQTIPAVAPADPRLARQQKQQQQQQQQLQQQQQQPPPQSTMSELERQAFLLQVMNMTDQEIALLPPDQQDKIYHLKRQYVGISS